MFRFGLLASLSRPCGLLGHSLSLPFLIDNRSPSFAFISGGRRLWLIIFRAAFCSLLLVLVVLFLKDFLLFSDPGRSGFDHVALIVIVVIDAHIVPELPKKTRAVLQILFWLPSIDIGGVIRPLDQVSPFTVFYLRSLNDLDNKLRIFRVLAIRLRLH
ncbi:hypothetical protein BD310DRAFT_913435 [Dichomitus squalens]|uniref:Uncharacterized protein n=1 Tax=Dichomitus squalens TaxID=114155 RepID=A0A4V2K9Q8_9APHY|nr:hypothetical protein BD310DRAFT_913435 [Dichomitus squalens]